MSKKKQRKEPEKEFVKEAKGRLWVLPFSREYEFRSGDNEIEELFLSGDIEDEHDGGPSLEELEAFEPGSMVTIMYDPETQRLFLIEVPGGVG